ncbi:hypothetical protein I545_1878 [Mycobacterium kansasii 662]|uniref:Uncharacterized protein n=1 Tax=Mycobacterium kansasii 662 TaxID=1299326 RepID=X7ZNG9_MYCKA|nr:hypothetical protein I545_1878 [Mycobacterium kansasii 662]KEP39947.1 hypothetical protein MKSMC1_49950 [Mycobacterium kansasii]
MALQDALLARLGGSVAVSTETRSAVGVPEQAVSWSVET